MIPNFASLIIRGTVSKGTPYTQGWKCRKITFDQVIPPPKYDCVVVKWVFGFHEKFHFGHWVALFVIFEAVSFL